MSEYNPMSALRVVRDAMKAQSKGTDPSGLLDEHGDPIYQVSKRPETLCILLKAFTDDQASLPPDFAEVEHSASGIRGHERPDGGCFVGAFDAPGDELGVVLVYGDPAMTVERAVNYSLAFRRKLRTPTTKTVIQ
jgi:hypothetical protein